MPANWAMRCVRHTEVFLSRASSAPTGVISTLAQSRGTGFSRESVMSDDPFSVTIPASSRLKPVPLETRIAGRHRIFPTPRDIEGNPTGLGISLERGLPANWAMRCVRPTDVFLSRASSAPTGVISTLAQSSGTGFSRESVMSDDPFSVTIPASSRLKPVPLETRIAGRHRIFPTPRDIEGNPTGLGISLERGLPANWAMRCVRHTEVFLSRASSAPAGVISTLAQSSGTGFSRESVMSDDTFSVTIPASSRLKPVPLETRIAGRHRIFHC